MSHDPKAVLHEIHSLGFSFFSGVPDSLLKEFCAILTEETSPTNHIIAANEGNAIAIGVGNYLATGKPPMLYMQNSGFGNALNPLISLADPEIYSIPLLIMIGWRGEPGIEDEPQHLKQGRVMTSLLDSLEIPFFIFSKDHSIDEFRKATELMLERSGPVVVLVSKDSFEVATSNEPDISGTSLTREEAIRAVTNSLDEKTLVISTTGMASRELWEIRKENGRGPTRDFLTVGSMGHASSIALGLNLAKPNNSVVCLDGDGAALMHLGSLAIVAVNAKNKFLHVVLNNGAHDSVGGQPTVGKEIDFCGIARSCGYSKVFKATNMKQIKEVTDLYMKEDQTYFLEILVRKGNRSNLGRPTDSPVKNKESFMNSIK